MRNRWQCAIRKNSHRVLKTNSIWKTTKSNFYKFYIRLFVDIYPTIIIKTSFYQFRWRVESLLFIRNGNWCRSAIPHVRWYSIKYVRFQFYFHGRQSHTIHIKLKCSKFIFNRHRCNILTVRSGGFCNWSLFIQELMFIMCNVHEPMDR